MERQSYSRPSKIAKTNSKGAGATPRTRPDGSPIDNDRVEIGPTPKAFAELIQRGIELPDLTKMREARLARLVKQIQKRDLDGVLLFDPLNIRYATDSTNMQLWTAHDFTRACFVSAEGYIVLWDFVRCEHLTEHLPLINERRSGAANLYFCYGDKEFDQAKIVAGEFFDVIVSHCADKKSIRVGVDKMEFSVAFALRDLGVDLHSGMAVLEHARLIKTVDEIKAMRCAITACEISVGEMQDALAPGITEVELWSHLHAANIARGGEWIEARLLASGPRTNPWMQEAGPRKIAAGDLVGFDTDLIGLYGMCCDMSRTWLCGDVAASEEQKTLYQIAYDHIHENIELFKPGTSFRELTFGGHQLPQACKAQRYCVKMHGVGLCDEFPAIYYPEDYIEGAFDYNLEPGMIFSVEAYIGKVGGRDGVKLEDQVLVTDDGYEKLTHYPHDEKLMG